MPNPQPRETNRWLFGVAIVVPLLLLVSVSVLANRAVKSLERTKEMTMRTQERRDTLALTIKAMVDDEAGQRGFILAQDPVFLEPYLASMTILPELRLRLGRILEGQESGARFSTLNQSIEERLAFSKRTIEMQEAGDHTGAVALVQTGEGKRLMDKVRHDSAGLEKCLDGEARHVESTYAAELLWNQRISWSMVALDVGVLVILAALLVRLRKVERFVHICAWSRTIQYEGEWISFEEYLSRKFKFSISHGISPEEARKMLETMR